MLFICYPKCSTCKKAQIFLDKKGIKYELRDIKENNPTIEELKSFILKSGMPVNKFFNTSGILYRENNLKEKLNSMSEEDKIKLLSTNGMLVKRPILVTDDKVLVGFKESDYENLI